MRQPVSRLLPESGWRICFQREVSGSLFLLVVYKGKGKIAFTAEFPVHLQIRFREEKKPSSVCEPCSDLTQVSWAYDILETDIVNAAVQCSAAF